MRSPAVAAKISVQKHVEDLDLLRQRLGLNRVTILAHSMGTFLAQSYLEAHPDHVKGLILAGAIAPLNDSLHSALGASNKIGSNGAHPCPLYVVIGAQDYVDFGVVQWHDAEKQIPNLKLRVLPEAGSTRFRNRRNANREV